MARKHDTAAPAANPAEQVAALRQQREDLLAELQRREKAFLPLPEALANVEMMIRSTLDRVEEKLVAYQAAQTGYNAGDRLGLQNLSAFEMAVFLDANGVKARCGQELQNVYQMPDVLVIPADDRPAALAELRRQIFDLECREEAIIEAAEEAGAEILRRADADPMAVLGLRPSDLPLPADWFSLKLERILNAAEDAGAAAINARQRRDELRLEQEPIRRRINEALPGMHEQVDRCRRMHVAVPAELSQEIERDERRIAELDDRMKRANNTIRQTGEVQGIKGGLACRLEEFVKSNSSPEKSRMTPERLEHEGMLHDPRNSRG